MRQPQFHGSGRFDSHFSGRSTHAHAVASNYSIASTLTATGTGIKLGASLTILMGAVMVGVEPVSGLALIVKGAIAFVAGQTLKAGGQTISETLNNGASGHHESGTQVTQRFSSNYNKGFYKPW